MRVGYLLLVCMAGLAAEEPEAIQQLLKVKRVFVDKLTGGAPADQFRDLIISSLQASKLFVITENEQRADATLRGAADDTVFTDTFSSSDGINLHSSISTGSQYDSKSRAGRSGGNASVGVGDNESTHINERKHEAMATVRLVNKDGDVIWSTTQESLGGKFRGASADVADKITKQLMLEFDRVKKATKQ